MSKKVRTEELFDCQTAYLKEFFASHEYPWEMLPGLKEYILDLIARGIDGYIINTEWLGRIFGNDVFSLFPLFYLEKIGCYNWGFVAGKYQTYEPWEGTWERYYSKQDQNVDFTKWFHDLYRPNHRPYDPREIDIIKEFSALADAEFEEFKTK